MSVSFEARVPCQPFGHCLAESDFLLCKEWPRILEERGSKELQLYSFFFSVVVPVLVCNTLYMFSLRAEVQCLEHN